NKVIEEEIEAPTVVLSTASDGKIINGQLGISPFRFEDKRASLLVDSYSDLDKVIRYMSKNSSKKLLIEVHTDTRGQSESNRVLSIDRAKGIQNLMVFKGIDLGRLEIAGLGEDQPLKDCDKKECKEDEQAQNNRVNFRLIDKEHIPIFGDEPEEEEFIDFSKELPIETEQPKKAKESDEKLEKQLERERKKQEKQLQKEQERIAKDKLRTDEAAATKTQEPAPVVLKRPRLKTTNNSKGYSYLVEIGPYKTVSPELADIILKMKLQASLRPSGSKEWVQLGAFATMAECEELQAYLIQEGFGKSKLIVLVDGERTTIKASKLKKEGLR
ncbi:OmpA family protein, partial [Chitinophagales bacterium]|nr:OmpA family protein [Chitinophagales bacterium]